MVRGSVFLRLIRPNSTPEAIVAVRLDHGSDVLKTLIRVVVVRASEAGRIGFTKVPALILGNISMENFLGTISTFIDAIALKFIAERTQFPFLGPNRGNLFLSHQRRVRP
jgi:hypothetical protein